MNKKKILNTSINLLIAFFAGAIPVNILLALAAGNISPIVVWIVWIPCFVLAFKYLRKAQAK
jgi:hypothetical protein